MTSPSSLAWECSFKPYPCILGSDLQFEMSSRRRVECNVSLSSGQQGFSVISLLHFRYFVPTWVFLSSIPESFCSSLTNCGHLSTFYMIRKIRCVFNFGPWSAALLVLFAFSVFAWWHLAFLRHGSSSKIWSGDEGDAGSLQTFSVISYFFGKLQ